MQQERVIKRADYARYDIDILKNSLFQFSDNGAGGFAIELVYKEPRAVAIRTKEMDQIVLENFEISREILVEMRRNFACHSTIVFGILEFRVHELVKTLNNIISMNNIYSSLSLDENGFQIKLNGKENAGGPGEGVSVGGNADDQSDEEEVIKK